ncbi:unnamed protein product [Dibothriocephalus latus]|uniref:Uncharacterized protein n=1 Tax=Dibothriocephalus latus TaxID=60516 RepID=A0A3P6TEX1_DIBLA|nr:unnamed protein product [Dibothriocephalus latus]
MAPLRRSYEQQNELLPFCSRVIEAILPCENFFLLCLNRKDREFRRPLTAGAIQHRRFLNCARSCMTWEIFCETQGGYTPGRVRDEANQSALWSSDLRSRAVTGTNGHIVWPRAHPNQAGGEQTNKKARSLLSGNIPVYKCKKQFIAHFGNQSPADTSLFYGFPGLRNVLNRFPNGTSLWVFRGP